MKKIILAALVIGALVGGTGLYGGTVLEFFTGTTEYVREHVPETIVDIQTVNELDVRVEEAREAARPTIEAEAKAMQDEAEAKAKAAYEAALAEAASTSEKYVTDHLKEVEDKVKTDYITEIEKTISSEDY